jgi:chromosome transmission fidelity protein 1
MNQTERTSPRDARDAVRRGASPNERARTPTMRRDAFPAFPYATAYGIQKDLMRHIYDACERRATFGAFESPTGTGKTLSVLIAAMSWIDDRRRARLAGTKLDDEDDGRVGAGETTKSAEDDEPDWLREYDAKRRKTDADEVERRRGEIRREMRARAKTAETRARLRRDAETRLREKIRGGDARDSAVKNDEIDKHTAEEREFLADEYDSGAENAKEDLRTLLRDGDDESDDDDAHAAKEEDDALRPAQQVILCSRTHSQLTQVIGELKRTVFGGSVANAEEQVAVAAVAGRAQLCVNPAVKSLGSAARINERCLDMSKGKAKPGEKTKIKACPYLSKRRKAMLELKEAALAKPMDIEDLAKLGESSRACPYYAARSALPEADLVLMPYASLLHADTREILGVKLENAVVVFDEAHNLVDAVHNSYGAAVTLNQLSDVNDMLTEYVERFKTRLSANNLRYLRTLTNITRAFVKVLAKETEDESKPQKRLTTLNDFLFECGQDTVNMFSLRRYLKESKVAHKIASYGERVRSGENMSVDGVKMETIGRTKVAVAPDPNAAPRVGAVHALTSLIDALASADSDGRMIYERATPEGDPATLRFVLLDAASRFKRVVEQARSVILVGGTLAPIPELVAQLFPDLQSQTAPAPGARQLKTFTCGHIIPRDNLLPIALSAGPTGVALDFTHGARADVSVIDELGRILLNACRVSPGGACVFFPSFKYADEVYARWESTGAMASIRGVKDVYREPRDASTLEQCLRDYAASVSRGASTRNGGAVLLCVVGGKLSEGINFKDELGRLVVMVGLPYANVADAELKARMDHLDTGPGNQGRGRAYYEALCMRGVNQSIGRAIRHVGDYACILLCDKRWGAFGSATNGSRTKAAKALPEWIEQRLVVPQRNYGEAHGRVAQFFRAREAKQGH